MYQINFLCIALITILKLTTAIYGILGKQSVLAYKHIFKIYIILGGRLRNATLVERIKIFSRLSLCIAKSVVQ